MKYTSVCVCVYTYIYKPFSALSCVSLTLSRGEKKNDDDNNNNKKRRLTSQLLSLYFICIYVCVSSPFMLFPHRGHIDPCVPPHHTCGGAQRPAGLYSTSWISVSGLKFKIRRNALVFVRQANEGIY